METGWLIETQFSGITKWWTGAWGQREEMPGWTTDPNECVRFARKEDAEKVIKHTLKWDDGSIFATEHVWS